MSPLLIPPSPLLLLSSEGAGHGNSGNAAAEILLVFLFLLVFWGIFRISSRKRS
jgi:hypothetical protein